MSDPDWSVQLRGHLGNLHLDIRFVSAAGPTLIIGPNGSGKTTVLRAIAGAAAGLEGRIVLRGRTLMDSSASATLPPEDRGIGYVPQGFALFPHLRTLENVAFGCGRGRAARLRAERSLDQLEARHLSDRRPYQLSGGERQRVALARALAIDPAGLLLDEPLSALDVSHRRSVRALLARHLADAALACIVVTHDLRDVMALSGQVVVLEAGRVLQCGSMREIANAPASEFAAEFFGPLREGVAT
ncbi:MAG: ABC transporter ATP-binding protein [Nannocystaceae bacterium]